MFSEEESSTHLPGLNIICEELKKQKFAQTKSKPKKSVHCLISLLPTLLCQHRGSHSLGWNLLTTPLCQIVEEQTKTLARVRNIEGPTVEEEEQR